MLTDEHFGVSLVCQWRYALHNGNIAIRIYARWVRKLIGIRSAIPATFRHHLSP